jgi:histidine triad (HIT) family protein
MSDLTHLFEKIAAGEIPSHRVYEDDVVYAFLDANPLSPGHTLIVPKERTERLPDLPSETAAAIGRVLPKIARAIVRATGASDFNVLVNNGSTAGQVIPHVHFHIIPKYEDGRGLGMKWHASPVEDGESMAATIASHID